MLLLESDLFQATMPNLFQLGGVVPMSVVTFLLAALFIAAWKAPGCVKEIGLFTLALGFLWIAIGLIRHADLIQEDDIITSPNVVWGGVKCWLIPFAYSIIVYIYSLIICSIRKQSNHSVRRWLKGIGLLALGFGLLWIPVGLIRNTDLMQATGDATLGAIWLGVKRSLIPFACSLIVYLISIIVRIVTSPRNC
jgi:hypothetical protein